MRTVRLRISGRVQGVGYRAWAIATATRLGLKGWVRNRRDGTVEALVTGEDGAVEAMVAACGDGPYGARVTQIAVEDDRPEGSTGFGARPTV